MVRCLSLPWSSSAGVDDAVGLEEVDTGVEVADSFDVVEVEKDAAEDVEEDVEWTDGLVAVTPMIVTVVGTSLTQPMSESIPTVWSMCLLPSNSK